MSGQKSLREVMPQTAQIVDELRRQFGKEAIDRIVLQGKAGRGTFYAAEIGPDGVLRQFGSRRRGGPATVANGQVVLRGA